MACPGALRTPSCTKIDTYSMYGVHTIYPSGGGWWYKDCGRITLPHRDSVTPLPPSFAALELVRPPCAPRQARCTPCLWCIMAGPQRIRASGHQCISASSGSPLGNPHLGLSGVPGHPRSRLAWQQCARPYPHWCPRWTGEIGCQFGILSRSMRRFGGRFSCPATPAFSSTPCHNNAMTRCSYDGIITLQRRKNTKNTRSRDGRTVSTGKTATSKSTSPGRSWPCIVPDGSYDEPSIRTSHVLPFPNPPARARGSEMSNSRLWRPCSAMRRSSSTRTTNV